MNADNQCESLIRNNINSYNLIKSNITKEELRAWTELVKGLQPIDSRKQSIEEWMSRYATKISKIAELDSRIQSLIEMCRVNRIFVVCCFRKLQKEYGYNVNFNMFKDSAIRKIIKQVK